MNRLVFFAIAILVSSCGFLGEVHNKSALQGSTINDGSGNSQPTPVTPPNANPKLTFYSPQPAVQSMCWPTTITATKWGIAYTMPATMNVALSAPASLTFFDSSDCTHAITSTTIVAGTSSTNVWFKAANLGTVAIQATPDSSSGFAAATMNLTVQAMNSGNGVTSRIALNGAAQATVGDCLPLTASFYDSQGNPQGFSAAISLALSSNDSVGVFYSQPDCSNGSLTSSIAVPAGVFAASFYYRSTKSGLSNLTSAGGGLTGTHNLLLVAGAAQNVSLTGPATLAGAECGLYSIAVKDQYGNNTSFGAVTNFTLATSPNGSFSSSSNCSNTISSLSFAATQSSGVVYYSNGQAGAKTLTATGGSFTGTLPVTISSNGPGINHLVIVGNGSTSTSAGICFGPFKLELRDTNNALVTGTSVTSNLSATNSGQLFSDSSCGGTAISQVGLQTDFYFRDTVAESSRITADDASHAYTSASFDVTVNAGARSKLAILSSNASFTAGQCTPLSVVSQDAFGNGVKGAFAVDMDFSFVPTVSGATVTAKYFSDSNCATQLATNGSGRQTFSYAAGEFQKTIYFTNNKTGTGTWIASGSGVANGTLNFAVAAAGPHHISLKLPAQFVEDTCTSVQALLLDQYDNATVATSPLSLNLTQSAGEFYSGSACSSGQLVSQVVIATGTGQTDFYFMATDPGHITGTIGAPPAIPNIAFMFDVVSVNPTMVVIRGVPPVPTTGPATATAGQCLAFIAQTRDASVARNTVANLLVNLTANYGQLFSDSSCASATTSVTILAGQSQASFWYRPTTAVASTLTATSLGLTAGTYLVNVSAGTASQLTYTGPTDVVAGVCAGPYLVSALDAYNNVASIPSGTSLALSGKGNGHFASSANCGASSYIDSATVNSPNVSLSYYFIDTKKEGPLTFRVQASGFADKSLAVTVGANSPHHIVVEGNASVWTGQCAGPVRFKVVDAYENPITFTAAKTFNLTQSGTINIVAANCPNTTPVTSVTIPANTEWSQTFGYNATTAQSTIIMASTPSGVIPQFTATFTAQITTSPLPNVNITASGPDANGVVIVGAKYSISWATSSATSCSVKRDSTTLSSALSGTAANQQTYAPTTYTVACTNSYGTTTKNYAVTVTAGWIQVNGKTCAANCTAKGLRSVASPQGHYCASGENRIALPVGVIQYTHDIWGSDQSGFCTRSDGDYCYSTCEPWDDGHQTPDYDDSDWTVGCYCAP